MSSKTRFTAGALFVCALLFVITPAISQADDCTIWGTSTAVENTEDPEMGDFRYTLDVAWNINSQHALSHVDIILALGECECICTDFSYAVKDTAGFSTGYVDREEPCTAWFNAEFNCHGDPSIGLEEVPMMKFEDMTDDCEPALVGSGTFTFYSDWPPMPVQDPEQLVALKVNQDVVCFGELIGDLPMCDCPTPAQERSWGRLKTLYR